MGKGSIGRVIVVASLLGIVSASVSVISGQTSVRAAASSGTDVTPLQTLINQDRASNGGLAPLTWSPCLAAIAVQNAERMVVQGYISHTNGPELDLACGSGSTLSAGENVAYISSGIDDPTVNSMYMNSPGHRANILGAYQYVATAWAVAPNGYAYNAEEFLSAAAPLVADGYVPLVPARILDTRNGIGGVPVAQLGAGATMTVQVAGTGGVPGSNVGAVVVNVTVTNTTAPSHLTVYRTTDARPNASNLNWVAGQTVPNLIEAAISGDGQLSVYNDAGATDVIMDVEGYVPMTAGAPGSSGLYRGLVPARLMDTRTGNGGTSGPVTPNTAVSLQVTGRGGVPSSGVAAVALNVTVTNPTSNGYVTVYPTGYGLPLASNLNFVPGQVIPNRVIVKVGAGGQVNLFNFAGYTHLVVDVNGWYTDGSVASTGGTFTGLTSARILDTRFGTGGISGKLGPGGSISLSVAGSGGIPAMNSNMPPSAVVLNVTVTDTSAASYLRVYPSDANPVPSTSDLNWTAGVTVPNLVIVRPGADGRIGIYNGAGATDVIVDVLGYTN